MNLLQLEYALTLERLGSFTQAAKSLGMTQPALSLQIKNLESEIGIALFDRSKSKIEPTEQGIKFLMKAGEIVSASKQLKEYAYSLGNEHKGLLKLGVIPTLSPFLIPLFIDEFTSNYPDIHIEVHEQLTEQVLEGIRIGDLDGGIISTPVSRSGIEVEPLFYESFYLYKNDESFESLESFSISNIEIENLWLLREGNCFRDQVNDICSFRNIRSNTQMKYLCSSIDSLIRMVDHYGGATILPELTTLSLETDQEKHLAMLDNKIREIGFVSRKLSGKEHLFHALTETIKSSIPARMKAKDGREVVDPGINAEW